jgi:NAD(P)-dependent dehydrogenase (short-subunit alcohol dehydrogenase family)
MKFDISDKKILLIGGNGLLGSEYTSYLSDKVKNLSILDLHSKNIDKFINKKNINFYKCNIMDKKNFINKINKAIINMKGIDVLINNAALTSEFSLKTKSIFNEFDSSSWDESINVTLSGTYLGCISVIPKMLKEKKGQIINIASHYGVVSPNHSIYEGENFNCPLSYSVAKSGVISLTKWLATKYASQGIRINSLSPGGVENNQSKTFIKKYKSLNPSKKMADKSDFNELLHYLISDSSKYIIGHNFIVDGGASVW